MVEIKIIKNTVCNGERVRVGDVVETTDQAARYLLVTQKAEPYGGSKKVPVVRGTKPKTAPKAKAKPRNKEGKS